MVWAAIRARSQILVLLLDRGADITICDKVGFTALDQAVIHGNYEEALILKQAVEIHLFQGLRPKSFDFYDLKREMFVNFKVDIQDFLSKLDAEVEKNDSIFTRKPSSSNNSQRKS